MHLNLLEHGKLDISILSVPIEISICSEINARSLLVFYSSEVGPCRLCKFDQELVDSCGIFCSFSILICYSFDTF
jgi:hypothetical protein